MIEPSERLAVGMPQIVPADGEALLQVLASGWLGSGPKVARFEAEFAAYQGITSEQAVALNACTAALHLALQLSGIGPGDEVIVPALTFCATVNAVVHAGATPVLADIDPNTLTLDPTAAAARITPRSRALIPVHFAGRPCDMDALQRLAEHHRLTIVEDCAHAIEARYGDRAVGTLGDFGCFSFHATKNLTTGDGGMLLAHRPDLAQHARILALHGIDRDAWQREADAMADYEVVGCGYKYRMNDLQAALGLSQLQRLMTNWQRRRALWQLYQDALAELPVTLPAEPAPYTRHAYHLYPLRLPAKLARSRFLAALRRHAIIAGIHYRSLAEHRYYQQRFGWRPEDYPNALQTGRRLVSLPLSARFDQADGRRVVAAVKIGLADSAS